MEYLSHLESDQLPGDLAFKLYDTYGFPLELTTEIAQEQNVHVDVDGFTKEMENQKQRARSARTEEQSMARQSADLMHFTIPSTFSYDPFPQNATVVGLFINGQQVESLEEEGDIVFDHTIFYAESGGQVADRGIIHFQGIEIPVLDVKKAPNHQHLHHIDPQGLTLQVGDVVRLEVNQLLRNRTMRHHSAVHLLQKALREVLGNHIEQAGSYVDDERLRFDFTHFEKIKREQLEAVERRVNAIIDQGLAASIEVMTLDAAKEKGAIALFGEKYGDEVRVVEFGDYSMELCGGCHVTNTKDIGVFVIDFEESISSGVRRIQASCGIHGYEIMKKREAIAESAAKTLGALSISEIDDRLHALQKQFEQVRGELSIIKQRFAQAKASELFANADDSNGYPLVLSVLTDFDKDSFAQLAEELRIKNDQIVVFLVNQTADRISLVAAAGAMQVKQGLHCGKLVKLAAQILGGSGGGRPELAQAGGKQPENIPAAIDYVRNYLKKQ
jgi:alanyl-tRNA synthetase